MPLDKNVSPFYKVAARPFVDRRGRALRYRYRAGGTFLNSFQRMNVITRDGISVNCYPALLISLRNETENVLFMSCTFYYDFKFWRYFEHTQPNNVKFCKDINNGIR